MNWRDVVTWLFPAREVAKPSTEELREAQELRTENRRHVKAIERHIDVVSSRVRADAEQADRRATRR